MAESRIEKFKEYRNSIISSHLDENKTTIDTTLKTSEGGKMDDYKKELQIANKINAKSKFEVILFLILLIVILTVLIIFGIKLF